MGEITNVMNLNMKLDLTIEICCKKTRFSKGKSLLQKSLKNWDNNTLNQKFKPMCMSKEDQPSQFNVVTES